MLQWNAGGLRTRSTELQHFLSSHFVDLICIQESNLESSSSFGIPEFSALQSGVVDVVAIPLLPRDGGIVEDHGTPETEQLSKVWTRDRREIESPKSKRCRVRSYTVQNEMMSWDGCLQALQKGFSILPILSRQELNSVLCLLQRRRKRTQRA